MAEASRCKRWDFTLPYREEHDAMWIHKRLQSNATKYVFQKEQGEGGLVHWQGRVNLASKLAPTAANKAKLHNDVFLGNGHWSVTSAGVHPSAREFSYVMKELTRIDGPWTEADYEEPPVLTRQLHFFLQQEMHPWQKEVLEWCSEADDRKIRVIWDTVGNIGKSVFAEYLEYERMACELPPLRSMEDLMACVMCQKVYPCYLIDMPRAMKKDKLGEFYSGVECLKNGVAYDKRYAFKKRRFDRPMVIIFTNTLPQFDLLSADRWDVFKMLPDFSLERYVQ